MSNWIALEVIPCIRNDDGGGAGDDDAAEDDAQEQAKKYCPEWLSPVQKRTPQNFRPEIESC